MAFHKTAGVVLIVGSVLFIVATVLPVSFQVYGEPDQARQTAAIEGSGGQWAASQALFGLGALVAAVGMGMAAQHLRKSSLAVLGYLGAAALLVGAVIWGALVTRWALDPQTFLTVEPGNVQFLAYSLITQAGLALFGVALLRSNLPSWPGWVALAGAVLAFLGFLVFRDMPPFVYYILTLVLGFAIFAKGWLVD